VQRPPITSDAYTEPTGKGFNMAKVNVGGKHYGGKTVVVGAGETAVVAGRSVVSDKPIVIVEDDEGGMVVTSDGDLAIG
jgi:hypothetical protein